MQLVRKFCCLSWCYQTCGWISKMIIPSSHSQHTVFQPRSLVCSGYFTLLQLKLSQSYSCFVFLEQCRTAGSCHWVWPSNSLEITMSISKLWPFLSLFRLELTCISGFSKQHLLIWVTCWKCINIITEDRVGVSVALILAGFYTKKAVKGNVPESNRLSATLTVM